MVDPKKREWEFLNMNSRTECASDVSAAVCGSSVAPHEQPRNRCLRAWLSSSMISDIYD